MQVVVGLWQCGATTALEKGTGLEEEGTQETVQAQSTGTG